MGRTAAEQAWRDLFLAIENRDALDMRMAAATLLAGHDEPPERRRFLLATARLGDLAAGMNSQGMPEIARRLGQASGKDTKLDVSLLLEVLVAPR